MFHVAGLNILTVPALSMGATVTVHRRFEPQAALEDIEGFGVTLFLATPPLTKAMAADPRWSLTNLSSVRALLIGGTVVAEDAIRAWQERSVPVTQGYGMTEVGPVATLVPHEAIPRKTLTAGKPTLHTRIRVVDRDGRDLPPGQPGEVLIQSPSVTTGYWRNSEATREAITDGWFKTGDLGLFDDEGFCAHPDRRSTRKACSRSSMVGSHRTSIPVTSPSWIACPEPP
jgi:fatty-acyl-CoA synthase